MQNFRLRRPFHRLALLGISIVLLVSLFLGGMAWLFYKAAQQQAVAFCRNVLSSSAHGEQAITKGTKNVFDNISFDPALFDLLNYEDVQPHRLLAGLSQLSIYRQSNYFIDSIYLYNPHNNTVYISSPNATLAVQTLAEFYDREAAELFENYSMYENMQPVSRRLTVSYPTMEDLGFISYLRYNTLAKPSESSVIMINVRQETFFEQMYTPLEGVDTGLMLVDKDGASQLAAAEPRPKGEQQVVQRVLDYRQSDGVFIMDADGSKTLVCYRPAFGGYWTLIFTANQNQMLSLLEMREYFLWIFIFAVVLGVLLSACIILFRRLAAAHRRQQQMIEKAQKTERAAAHEQRRKLILEALHAGNDAEKARFVPALNQAQIILDESKSTRLVLMVVDYYNTDVAQEYDTAKERAMLKYGICNIAEELLEENGICFACYENDSRCVALLQNMADEPALNEALIHFQQQVEEALKITVSLFVSADIYTAEKIPAVYEQLCNYMPYKQLFGPASMLPLNILEMRELQPGAFPDDSMKHVVSDILSMNLPQALLTLRNILDEISQYSYKSFQLFLMQVLTGVDNALEKLQRNNLVDDSLQTSLLVYGLSGLECIDDIHAGLGQVFGQIEAAVTGKQNGRHEQLLLQMQEIVEREYQDRSFSVNVVADEIGMSAAYVGRLFKRWKGVTLVEYILDVRMQHSRRMLEQTDLPVANIAEEVGFGDTPYFYKVFKKVNGVTPAVYRANCGKKQHEKTGSRPV